VVNIGQIKTPELELKLKFSGFETFLEEDLAPEVIKPTPAILQGSVYAKPAEKSVVQQNPQIESIPMETSVDETVNVHEMEKDACSFVRSYM
jgi:hypothetical protein